MNICCNSPAESNNNEDNNNNDMEVEIDYYALKKVIPLSLSSVNFIHLVIIFFFF